MATAPSWRGPLARRRAVIPAAGYHEWLPTEDADGKPVKQPYYIHPADGMLSFAGLYDLWADQAKDPDDPDRWLWSAAITTHHATWLAGVMNDRAPVILPSDRIDASLDALAIPHDSSRRHALGHHGWRPQPGLKSRLRLGVPSWSSLPAAADPAWASEPSRLQQ